MVHKQRIALVANTTWNISNFRKNILKALHEAGFEILVIAPVDEYIDYLTDFPYVKHISVKHLSRKGINPLQDLLLTLELIRLYKKQKVDLTLHYTIKPNLYGSFAARYLGTANISVITGLGYTFIHNGLINRLSTFLYRIALVSNSKVIFENHDDRILFLNNKLVAAAQALSVKGCGVDITHFQPIPKSSYQNTLVFIFVGRLLYDKGITEFVAVAKKIRMLYPTVQFWILGEIDTQNPAAIKETELQEWIAQQHVDYKGFVKDVRPYLAESDCIVLPSYREAIPRAIQEGMAMGKPAISTDVPGCREAIEHGKNGYLVPVQNIDTLFEYVKKMIEMPVAQRIAMGEYGRQKTLNEFDDRLIADQIVAVIQEVLQS